jgi:hypothetical protein
MRILRGRAPSSGISVADFVAVPERGCTIQRHSRQVRSNSLSRGVHPPAASQ